MNETDRLHHALVVEIYNRVASVEFMEQILENDQEDLVLSQRSVIKGRYPLHVACSKGASFEVISLLATRCPRVALEKDDEGNTPLNLACQGGCSLEVIQLLALQLYPGSVTIPNRGKMLPIHAAAAASHWVPLTTSLAIMKFLGDEYTESFKMTGPKKRTPLHVACHSNAPLEIIQYLTTQCEEVLSWKDSDGFTPLTRLLRSSSRQEAGNNNIDSILYLVDKDPNPTMVSDEQHGWTVWVHCRMDNLRIIQAFVKKWGVECLNVRCDTREGMIPLHLGQTPLHLLCHRCEHDSPLKLRILEYMVLEAGPDNVVAQDRYGKTPLHWLCGYSTHVKAAQFLMEQNPAVAKMQDSCSRLALHVACGHYHMQAHPLMILNLIRQYPQGLTHADRHLQTPLHLACIYRAPLIVIHIMLGMLLPGNVEEETRRPDRDGMIPLHLAQRDDVFDFLLSQDPPSALVKTTSVKEKSGTTQHNAFHRLCDGSSAGTRGTIASMDLSVQSRLYRMDRILALYPELISSTNSNGSTGLHLACGCAEEEGFEELIRCLIQRNRDIVYRGDSQGATPLHCLCQLPGVNSARHGGSSSNESDQSNNKLKIILNLVQSNCFPWDVWTLVDENGATPLHILLDAASSLHSSPLLLLLLHLLPLVECIAASVTPQLWNMKDHNGRTPLIVAAGHPCVPVDVIYFLIRLNPSDALHHLRI